MPLFRVTLHNEMIVWWIKAKNIDKLKGPLIHFDTHDDMGEPGSTDNLLLSDGSLDTDGIMKGACGQI